MQIDTRAGGSGDGYARGVEAFLGVQAACDEAVYVQAARSVPQRALQLEVSQRATALVQVCLILGNALLSVIYLFCPSFSFFFACCAARTARDENIFVGRTTSWF